MMFIRTNINLILKKCVIISIILALCIIACEKNEFLKKPTVRTIRVENTTTTTTNAVGEISNLEDFDVTEIGFCWSENSNPTKSDNNILIDLASVSSIFDTSITGLEPSKTYYLRAFASNSVGTGYGEEISFTTEDGNILITTADITNITTESATCGGSITNTTGIEITSKGVCWSTSQNPTTSDVHTTDGSGDGSFTSLLTGLTPNTTYYVKAYVTTSTETVDGQQVILKTYSGIVTDVDGNEYFTVNIGDQIWMAENLKTTHYANGDPISLVTNNTAWEELSESAYCYYNNDSTANADTYGALYNWYAVVDSRNLCPDGWYVPSDNEWKELEMFLGMSQTDADDFPWRGTDEGGKLKESGTATWSSPNTGATNETSFTALPGGDRSDNGTFESLSEIGYWWTSSDINADEGTLRCVIYDDSKIGRWFYKKNIGLSVRCIKGDDIVLPTVATSSASDVEETSATVGGNVTADGGAAVTERGVYYSTSTNPETTGTKLSIGSGPGSFSTSLTGLSPATTYYIKAYAINSAGTSYGSEINFTTTALLPTVTTDAITSITAGTATGGGNVTDDGGSAITAKGVCWSTSPNPTLVDFNTNDGTGIGAFISNLTGLSINTTYYVRSYATNSVGTSYGNEIEFTTKDGIPTLTTTEVTNLTTNSATSGGTITDNGGFTITARGVCWGTTSNPTIADSHTTDGTGTGSFTSSLTGLNVNTLYYVRSYATNAQGTFYGNEISFTTYDGIPTLTTTEITNITATTATSGGSITDDGGFSITARGVCWSTSSNPTITDSHTTDGSGTGSFTSSLTGLTENTTYYVRAYATNTAGTVYGDELSFTTSSSTQTITDYDGNVYNIVTIGTQVWMAENLKTTHYANGTAITLVESTTSWDALGYTDKAMCYYDNSSTNADTYGALYTWAAAMNGTASSTANPSGIQGACPDGWHLPSDDEWKQLEIYLGMSQADADATGYRGTNEGSKLAGNSGLWTNGVLENDASFGTSGFRALPAGIRSYSGTFYYLNLNAYFWSATESISSDAWCRILFYTTSDVFRNYYYKNNGFSVRCLKD